MFRFNVYTAEDRRFIMTAPMEVIASVFKMHREEVRRVVRELSTTGELFSVVHMNGRITLPGVDAVVIQRAK